MKKLLMSFVVVVLAMTILIFGLSQVGAQRINQPPAVSVAQVEVLADQQSLARGKHIAVAIAGCADCHAEDLAGEAMDHMPPGVRVVAPNLTTGAGSVVKDYTDDMWIRAIAHGVGGAGQALVAMPSEYYADMPAEELGALVGYLKSLPPVDRVLPPTELGVSGAIIFGVLDHQNLPVNLINHAGVGKAIADTLDGAYLASMSGCTSCHGKRLAGLADELGPPPGPNLTTLDWTVAQFRHSLDTGERPDGSVMDMSMPWPTLRNMTAEETSALWRYVLAQPERALGDND